MTEPKSFIDEMFDDAYKLQERKEALMKEIGANRDILRKMEVAGKLDDKLKKELAELYPPRTRKDDSEDDNGNDSNGEAPAPAAKKPAAKPAPANA